MHRFGVGKQISGIDEQKPPTMFYSD